MEEYSASWQLVEGGSGVVEDETVKGQQLIGLSDR